MSCLNVTPTFSLEVGPVQALFASSTRSGSASENAPLVRKPGADTDSVASPAVEVTVASVVAVYSRVTPGVNALNDAGAPSVNDRVAGTVPPTVPVASLNAPAALSAAWPPTIG